MATSNLKYQFSRLDISEKIIVVNVLVFIVNGLSAALMRFGFEHWFSLPAGLMEFAGRPWSVVTYSFFHGGLGHIFWNMLLLYFSGRIFLNLFSARRFINVYFMGVVLGGALFFLGYNVFPALQGANSVLIGASAGVMAVLIFVCTYLPNREVRVFFFNAKLWQVGVFAVLIDLVQIPISGNIGGHLAHLGGAALGYFYARQLAEGRDIGEGFSKLLDALGNWFRPSKKKGPLKTVHRTKASARPKSTAAYDKQAHQQKIDMILDKISKSGYESLSKSEKDYLFKAGKE